MTIVQIDKYRTKTTASEYIRNQTMGSFTVVDVVIWKDCVTSWFCCDKALIGLHRGDEEIMYIMPCDDKLKSLSFLAFFMKTFFRQLLLPGGKKLKMDDMVNAGCKLLKSQYKVKIVRKFPKKYKVENV